MSYGIFGEPSAFNAPNFIFDRIARGIAWDKLVDPTEVLAYYRKIYGVDSKIYQQKSAIATISTTDLKDGVFQGRYCLYLNEEEPEHHGAILMKKANGWYTEVGSTWAKAYYLRVDDETGTLFLGGEAPVDGG